MTYGSRFYDITCILYTGEQTKTNWRGKVVDHAIFKNYLALIEQAYKAGNASEHTHRPALKDLLEAFQPGITSMLRCQKKRVNRAAD